MQREDIERALQAVPSVAPLEISAEILSQFAGYFGPSVVTTCSEKIISDESLFRDYSRFSDRKVDFLRVRNPFTLSKYTISLYEKIWHIKQPNSKTLHGPFNSYEMDEQFKQGKIFKDSLVGVLKDELIRFENFVEIAYPLPKIKYRDIGPSTAVKDMGLLLTANKFSNIIDESEMLSIKGSRRSRESTPFKKTPFKHLQNESKTENFTGEKFVPIPNDNGQLISSSKSKPGSLINTLVADRSLVKNKRPVATRLMAQSAKEPGKSETDAGGNYTAIKRDTDERQYLDLSKKIEFEKIKNLEEDDDEHKEDGFEIDFENINIQKH